MSDFYVDRPFFKELQEKKDIVGVEIGVMSGHNAEDILVHLDIKKLYLIDPWCNYGFMEGHGMLNDDDTGEACYQATIARLKAFADKIVVIKSTSNEAKKLVPTNLDFIYIDGNHRYQYVLTDIVNYASKVKEGGWVAGHDFKTGEQGVLKAVVDAFGDTFQTQPPAWDWWHKKEIDDNEALTKFIDR